MLPNMETFPLCVKSSDIDWLIKWFDGELKVSTWLASSFVVTHQLRCHWKGIIIIILIDVVFTKYTKPSLSYDFNELYCEGGPRPISWREESEIGRKLVSRLWEGNPAWMIDRWQI
jgi:hypothetical protein